MNNHNSIDLTNIDILVLTNLVLRELERLQLKDSGNEEHLKKLKDLKMRLVDEVERRLPPE